jgi:hypothetical protein
MYLEGGAMGKSMVSSSELYRHLARVKKAAEQGPVFVTRYGRVEYVLMTFEAYTKLIGATEQADVQTEG